MVFTEEDYRVNNCAIPDTHLCSLLPPTQHSRRVRNRFLAMQRHCVSQRDQYHSSPRYTFVDIQPSDR